MRFASTRAAKFSTIAALAAVTTLTGCSRYYQVTDLNHGDVYYTESFPEQSYDEFGQASFVDARTGAVVTLTNAGVRKVGRKYAQSRAHAYVPDSD